MPVNIACEALKCGRRLALTYEGLYRIVEVHAVGTSTAGKPVMRVWQISGGLNRSATSGWRLMRLDKAKGLFITDQISEAPRSGYKSGDRDMHSLICQI